jgi:hypothetical protein
MSVAAYVALFCLNTPLPSGASEKQPVVIVRGPTLVAFFEPVSQEKLEKDPDSNEALADFQLYAKNVREPLRKAGIEFHELYAHSFRLRVGNRINHIPARQSESWILPGGAGQEAAH